MSKDKRYTRRQLHAAALRREREERDVGETQLDRKWEDHEADMKKMLKGIDTERAGYD